MLLRTYKYIFTAEVFLTVLLLRVWHSEQNLSVRQGSSKRKGRRGRRATLADSASELSPNLLRRLASKSSDALQPSHSATAPDKNHALRSLRESDKLRKQVGLAHRASHELAALSHSIPSAVMPLKNSGKNFIRRILVT